MPAVIDRPKAILFLVIAAVLWSTSGILVKVLPWSPIGVLAGRSIFSSLVFLVYLRRFPFRPTRWQWLAAGSYILTQFFLHFVHPPDNSGQCHLPAIHRTDLHHLPGLLAA